jgi:signal transduction histidine kinase
MEELASKSFLEWILPRDAAGVSATLTGRQPSCQARHVTKNGDALLLEIRVDPNDKAFILAYEFFGAVDLETGPDDKNDEASVRGTLHTIARIVEDQNPGLRCSILLVADGKFVRGAGPSLPEEYNNAIDGVAIGPTVGSCGTAIYWNVPVIVENIQADPLWTPLAKLAQKAGVAACWSYPFTTNEKQVIGALALYASEPQAPTIEQMERLRTAARMTGLAVERGRATEALERKIIRELELEDQLLQAAKMESVGRLAGGVAHDFNNMLSVILGHTELAMKGLKPDHPLFEALSEIQDAARRSTELTSQLLAFARKQTIAPAVIDLNETVAGMLKMLKRLLGENIDLIWKPDPALWRVKVDTAQMTQLLANLCVNARDAVDGDGEITIATVNATFDEDYCTHHAEFMPGDYVLLTVSDNGCGMDAETRSRIFEPFFTTKKTGEGTGLGLATVYGIIKQNHGVIHAHSELGQGAIFSIYLPRCDGSKPEPERSNPPTGTTDAQTILLVEDEPSILRMTTQMLERLGHQVLGACHPDEAIRLAREHTGSIYLLMTDVVMPQTNGRDLARKLQSIYPGMKCLFMSGYMADIIHGKLDDGVHFISKPFSMSSLAAKLREVRDR